MKYKLPILIALVALVIGIWKLQVYAQAVNIGDASAATSITLMAIPPKTDTINVRPGETFQTTVQIRNVSQIPQQIATEVQDFVIGDDGKTPIPISEQQAAPLRWSLASWVTAAPISQLLQPNQKAVVNLVIQVPKDALPGGHYAMVLHSPDLTGGKKATAQGGRTPASVTQINQRVGTLLYVIVAGNIKENAIIHNFTAPSWVEFGPVPMKFTLENLSDIHIAPDMSIEIRDILGRKIDTITVEKNNVFPYSKRDFSASFQKTWGLGPYYAKLVVAYGTTGKVAMATLMFWMIPYKIILAVLVMTMTLLTAWIVIRRHLIHRNSLETQHIEVLEERIRELEKNMKQ